MSRKHICVYRNISKCKTSYIVHSRFLLLVLGTSKSPLTLLWITPKVIHKPIITIKASYFTISLKLFFFTIFHATGHLSIRQVRYSRLCNTTLIDLGIKSDLPEIVIYWIKAHFEVIYFFINVMQTHSIMQVWLRTYGNITSFLWQVSSDYFNN